MPQAMKGTLAITMESMRAAALAVHSAAGLATQARSSFDGKDKSTTEALAMATRVLRSAEALCRSGLSIVAMVSEGTKDGEKKGVVAAGNKASQSKAARKRQRRAAKKKSDVKDAMEFDATGGGYDVDLAGAAPFDAANFVSGLGRALAPLVVGQSSNGGYGGGIAPTGEPYPIGIKVELQGLTTRPDLAGQLGTVSEAKSASGRYAVKIHGSNEKVLVKAENLKAALIEFNSWPG